MKKSSAYLNILKLRVNMALKRKRLHNYPVQAYIEPTLVCNLRCPACPTGLQLGLRPSASMKWDLFKSAIDEIGDYVFSLYMYNWGEPLLHRQTPEMIKYAKEKDIYIILSTNLSLKLSDEYIERLVQSGLDRLIVSLDGTTEETYVKYRLRGEFQLVRENMARIQAAKKKLGVQTPEVVWQFLVFKHNELQIEEAQAQFREWGADTLSMEGAIMPVPPHDKGYAPSTIPKYDMYHPDHHFQRQTERHERSGRPCSWLYGVFVLNPNGKVSPCCASAEESTDFGDYQISRGFFDVWNNGVFQRARTLFTTNGTESFTNGTELPSTPAPGVTQSVLVQIKHATPTLSPQDEHNELIAGMGSNVAASLDAGELICQKCPIPWRQDDVLTLIAEEVYRLVRIVRSNDSLRTKAHALFAYLLMGAPDWRYWFPKTARRLISSSS
jgi:MoaA/NifB/PqqE/SkfB family radical SAM enzyme